MYHRHIFLSPFFSIPQEVGCQRRRRFVSCFHFRSVFFPFTKGVSHQTNGKIKKKLLELCWLTVTESKRMRKVMTSLLKTSTANRIPNTFRYRLSYRSTPLTPFFIFFLFKKTIEEKKKKTWRMLTERIRDGAQTKKLLLLPFFVCVVFSSSFVRDYWTCKSQAHLRVSKNAGTHTPGVQVQHYSLAAPFYFAYTRTYKSAASYITCI